MLPESQLLLLHPNGMYLLMQVPELLLVLVTISLPLLVVAAREQLPLLL